MNDTECNVFPSSSVANSFYNLAVSEYVGQRGETQNIRLAYLCPKKINPTRKFSFEDDVR